MIDPPSGPGEFILSEDGSEWLPLTADPIPTAPKSEDSSDGLPRPDTADQGRGNKRNP